MNAKYVSLFLVLGGMLSVGASSPAIGANKVKHARNARLPASAAATRVNELLSGSKCFASANQLLSRWQVSADWRTRPADMDGGKTYSAPTDAIGTWVQVSFYPNETVEAVRLSPDATVRISWQQPGCVPKAETTPRDPAAKGSFSDKDLDALLQAKRPTLIYVWSPMMPISVMNLGEAEKEAKQLGLDFLPLLDPTAPDGAVKELLRDGKINPAAARRLASLELVQRDAIIHFPTTLSASRGRLSPIYPGMWEQPAYLEKFLREYL